MDGSRPSRESQKESAREGSEDSGSGHATPKPAAGARGRAPPRSRKFVIAAALLCLVILALGLGLGLGLGLKNSASQPPDVMGAGQKKKANVLVIMSDDQDMLLDSMSVMPNVNRLLGDQGVRFERHYCTVAWCCPSRVNFLTGRFAHNTNVTSVVPPYGGWQKFAEVGLNDNYLPVWINETGIGTYYVGKFLNGYSVKDYATPAHPKAWTESTMLVDPYTYNYYHSHWTNGYTSEITPYNGIHTTNVTTMKALSMLDTAAQSNNQFFMMVTPVAPHQELIPGRGSLAPPVPDPWKGVFNDRIAPRTENFNPVERSGASWVYNSPRLKASEIETCDTTYAHRLGNIAAIDEMVNSLVERLDYHGILNNTYVIYTTDNGFHIGNHRLLPGKRCPYEEDVNIPLLMRGPDVPHGVNSTITNSHTDMAPTILQMLGLPLRSNFDGAPIAYTNETLATNTKNEIVNVEFWDGGAPPIGVAAHLYYNNTYKALRLMTGDYSLYYSRWCTGEREFYDMKSDSQQMHNLLAADAIIDQSVTYYGRPQSELIARMDAVLMVTKSCKQEACRNPWGVLFPAGNVTTLEQSLASDYDSFFEIQPKVSFEKCTKGYIQVDEGAEYVTAFGSSQKVFPGDF